jgi:hypothetical protein
VRGQGLRLGLRGSQSQWPAPLVQHGDLRFP